MAKIDNAKRLRSSSVEDLSRRLEDRRKELMHLRAQLASGGSIDNPGRISVLRREIARIMTVIAEKNNED